MPSLLQSHPSRRPLSRILRPSLRPSLNRPLSRPRRGTAVCALGAAAVLVLSACGSEEPVETDLTADADPDASLVVYSGRNENLVGGVFEAFEAQTGIDVEVRYGSSAEMAAQLQEEGSRTDADVFLSQDAGALGAIQSEGLAADLPMDTLALVPEEYRSEEGQWVGVTGRVRVLAYDPDTVSESELPASAYEMTEPQWQGKVGIAPANASFQSFVTAMRVLDGEDAARDWLDGMVANDAATYDNNIAMVQAIEAGELEAALTNHYYVYEQAAEIGVDELRTQNHTFASGDVGGLVNVSGAAVIEGTNKGASALALLEYLLATDAQDYFVTNVFEYPLVAGIPGPAGAPALADLDPPAINLSDLDSLAETQQLLEEVGLL